MRPKQYLSQAIPNTLPIALYNSAQLYAIEQAWFAQGYNSFALMQQAAWQMTQQIIALDNQNHYYLMNALSQNTTLGARGDRIPTASIWVGQGNNGGDGWLIAHYLQQAGWQVQVIAVGTENLENFEVNDNEESKDKNALDAKKARQIALAAHITYQCFKDESAENFKGIDNLPADVYIDALFGIGLDRAPAGIYKKAIEGFNKAANHNYGKALVIAVDIPSGLVASTGQVFKSLAISADVTLCLIARKFGLHTKDGTDYSGLVIDMPLIPFSLTPAAILLSCPQLLSPRRQNSYKGSYGHVLVIGGNRVDGSQGMGGAAILASASAMATGAGKITAACHGAFHGALLTSLPDAMTINLHDQDGVKSLIKDASVVAIGMGLGRDSTAKALFVSYLQAIIEQGCPIVVDADGLYHLANLKAENHELIEKLKVYSRIQQVCFTPHSGEAARLLDKKITAVENDRLVAIKQCAATYGGDWVLKGVGSLVLEQVLDQSTEQQIYICAVGNAGMATAGMGDVLSGAIAALLAQQDLTHKQRSLHQAVLIHGLAGDLLVNQTTPNNFLSSESGSNPQRLVGQRGLQAHDMPVAIGQIMQLLTL